MPAKTPPKAAPSGLPRGAILLLFGLALTLRILFWQATPDADWPHSAYYKGDALTWVAQAQANASGQSYEFDLPLRPPGAAALLSLLWDGRSASGRSMMILLWCLLGAAVAPLVAVTTARAFNPRVGLITGLICAASTGLMVLSTSLNNETPYLFVVCLAFSRWTKLRRRPTRGGLLTWGLLNALACLIRVEHLLIFGLTSLELTRSWGSREARGRWVLIATAFVLTLLPWHLAAWTAIHRFNTEEPEMNPTAAASQEQVESALAFLQWTPEAREARDRLPAFCRRTASNFVAATVAYRGGREVDAEDFGILEEAFGYHPEPLGGFPFVALYGGLNFHLAHYDDTVGFSRAALDRPPPLALEPARYPPFLLGGLPPPDLAFVYPPHVESVNHGWRLGLSSLQSRRRDAAKQTLQRLGRFGSGATFGFGGYNLPLGLSGVRYPADIVLPKPSVLSRLWWTVWLAAALVGLLLGLQRGRETRADLAPWLSLLATKMLVTVAFFGYARHGATVVPVVGLLAAIACDRLFSWRVPRKSSSVSRPATASWAPRWFMVFTLLALTTETARYVAAPTLRLDDRPVLQKDPWPDGVHAARQLEID